jgi:hypothetical protein
MPSVPIQVRLSVDEVSELDSYRRSKADPPTRARALRELACGTLRKLLDGNDTDAHKRALDTPIASEAA